MRDNTLWVVGGVGDFNTEQCVMSGDDELSCISHEPSLYYYSKWPEMFLVDLDFCIQ